MRRHYKDIGESRSWQDPADEEFDASSYGEEELDDMSLTDLLTEVFSDIHRGKLLRHTFVDGLLQHGYDFMADSMRAQLPHLLVGMTNAFLGTRGGMTEDELFEEVILTEDGFDKERRDPGAIADIVARNKGVPPENLPSWMTHSLAQAVQRNTTEVNLGLREMADRLLHKGYSDLASEVKDYALRTQHILDSAEEGPDAEETTALFGRVLRVLSEDRDPRVGDYARRLQAMLSSGERKKHQDMKRELKRRGSGLKDEASLDDVFKKSAGEGFDDALADLFEGLPKNAQVFLPYGVAALGAIGLFFLGHTVLGNAIEKRMHDNDLFHRTSFAASVEDIPEQMDGLANVGHVVADAGNFSALMDRGYMDANADMPFDYGGLIEVLVEDISETQEELDALMVQYGDPALQEALWNIEEGGEDIDNSVRHSSYNITHEQCSTDGDGNRTCITVCDFTVHSWRVDHERGRKNMESIRDGFYSVEVLDSGIAVAELQLPVFSGEQYENMDNKTIRTYNQSSESIGELPALISEFEEKWESAPEKDGKTTACYARPTPWYEDLVDDISSSAGGVSGLLDVKDNLEAYDEVLETAEERLTYARYAKDVFAEHPGMGDSSIDILRSLGYPSSKGHLYQEEIDNYSKIWRWGLGMTGIAVAGIGLYVFESSDRGRRRGSYRSYSW